MGIYYGWPGFDTSIILDCLDTAEYNSLTDARKDYFRIIISAGNINFREGAPIWNALHAFFPDGSNTWTALLAASRMEYNETPPH